MKHALILGIALIALTGCDERKQSASNALAGVDALESLAAPAAAGVAGEIASGIKANIAATAGTKQADLPPPNQTPDQIVADPGRYREDAEAAEAKATLGFLRQLAGWGSAVGLTLLGIARFWPGAHQPIVSLIQRMLENRVDRQTREREEGLAEGAKVMMGAIESLDTEGKIKAAVARKISSKAGDAVDAYLAEMGKR